MRRVTAKVRKWVMGHKAVVVLLAGIATSMTALALFGTTMVYTSTEAFCATSCHEMANNVTLEYRDTIHDRNRTGVRAICPDCHVPHAPIPLYIAKMGALNDLWVHHVTKAVDTREKFEAQRSKMAVRVWTYMKGNDSRECRHCHDVAKMDAEKQTPMAQRQHARGRREKMTCVDCHFGIAHQEPKGGPGPQEIEVDRSLIPRSAIF
ncbi:MAG: NapC/NirT family cytochrome c [Burkholderiales bacterium]|nr:NapC/NirT family cytochrome c [Burkholderiales bacterium]